jgi:type II secretory pathway pseudopilin PulG
MRPRPHTHGRCGDHPRHVRRGMVLLEVIIALTIFMIAGLSAVVWVRQTLLTVDHAQAAVEEMTAASDYLDRIALWPQEDLDRHLGARREGPWVAQIGRLTPTIYEVVIGDSSSAEPLLRTWLYRAELLTDSLHAN